MTTINDALLELASRAAYCAERVCWCILATLNDGSVYHYDNLIKV